MTAGEPLSDLEIALRDRFALHAFRPGQREVIEQVLGKRDVLCVMPTGGGKSLCYQLPALLLNGLTLVVSPLIALMKDQVDVLRQRGIRATLLNSSLDPEEQRARLFEIEAGAFDLVYVAPERFRSPRFIEAMNRVKPALLAIDEAHCISEWGHDFRPDYARLGTARRALGFPPCIALTATATDIVRRDIADQLDLQDPAHFVTGFDRPNLSYAVIPARREEDKLIALAKVLEDTPGSAVIYASSRDRCKNVALFLEKELRRSTVIYHAGLQREERNQAQDRFMSGEAEVVVATNAFGMGVDKSDIRSVIHFNMPGTLEAYYQEAGRAGRDGEEARCVLLYAPGDRRLQELFIENEYPSREMIYRVYEFLRNREEDPIELTHAEIREQAGIDEVDSAVGTALKILESSGGIERFLPRENMAIVRINLESGDPSLLGRLGNQAHVQRLVLLGIEGMVAQKYGESIYFHPENFANSLGIERAAFNRAVKHLVEELPIDYVPPFRGNAVRVINRNVRAKQIDIDFQALDVRRRREFDKLGRMVSYCEAAECRRSLILGYFGDTTAVHCGHCDNCEGRGGGSRTSKTAIDTSEGQEVLLKALSGVARCTGRYGKSVVVQMLLGSKSEKMVKFGLDQLSTFGILNAFRQPELLQILEALTKARLLESHEVEPNRPIIRLSDRGRMFLKDRSSDPVILELPTDLASKVKLGGGVMPVDAMSTDDSELADRLRKMRLEFSKLEARPAYAIFPDDTLAILVRDRPGAPPDLMNVKGLGAQRRERYGRAILDVIAGRIPEMGVLPTKRSEPQEELEAPTIATKPLRRVPVLTPTNETYVATEEWTWRLLDRGFRPEEAAAIRGLDLLAIIRHATLAARKGRSVAIDLFLDRETLARWRVWRTTEPGSRGEVPEDGAIATDLWALFVACDS
jgi:ATP-dependent DNA helicase RecQ